MRLVHFVHDHWWIWQHAKSLHRFSLFLVLFTVVISVSFHYEKAERKKERKAKRRRLWLQPNTCCRPKYFCSLSVPPPILYNQFPDNGFIPFSTNLNDAKYLAVTMSESIKNPDCFVFLLSMLGGHFCQTKRVHFKVSGSCGWAIQSFSNAHLMFDCESPHDYTWPQAQNRRKLRQSIDSY